MVLVLFFLDNMDISMPEKCFAFEFDEHEELGQVGLVGLVGQMGLVGYDNAVAVIVVVVVEQVVAEWVVAKRAVEWVVVLARVVDDSVEVFLALCLELLGGTFEQKAKVMLL